MKYVAIAAVVAALIVNRITSTPTSPVATVVEGSGIGYHVGTTIQTNGGERLLINANGAKVGLFEHTAIVIITMQPDDVELTVIRGRVAIAAGTTQQKIAATSPAVQVTSTGGAFSFINYDWQQLATVVPLSGTVVALPKEATAQVLTTALTVNETPPYESHPTGFTPQGDVKDFYDWFTARTTADTPE